MDEWAVALILIGVSVLVTAGLIGMCRMLGGWTFLFAFITGNKEERTQLATHEEFGSNGYISYPPPGYLPNNRQTFIPQQSFSDTLKSVQVQGVPKHNVPPIPPPPASDHPSRRFSLDMARRASIDTELPDILSVEGGGSSAKLQRAMSCDSVCSDTSVVLDTLESPAHNGELEVSLEYLSQSEELIVTVIRGRGLTLPDSPSTKLDSYIRVVLQPDDSTIMQTAVQRGTKDPEYKERFVFNVTKASLPERVLKCIAYTSDRAAQVALGQAEVNLLSINLNELYQAWLPLIDNQRKPIGYGELLFSLSYLPTAERLTVVLVKARNLVWTDEKDSADPFVKIYLLQKGKKISKKKTSVKRGDRNPVFNEAMIFSVPAAALQNIQLRLTVAEFQSEGKTPAIGHIFVGPHCSGKQLSHWNQMISAPRKPTAMWHPLKKRDG
ncbi:synaptotagmin-12 [Parasteatoda tepidariorum]|nr:synaptotagmin-12 [Parasteatoda tepidariorum]